MSRLFVIFLTLGFGQALAANYPCSGRAGGVSHCENGKFICNDGRTSQSKKVCNFSEHGAKKAKKKQQDN